MKTELSADRTARQRMGVFAWRKIFMSKYGPASTTRQLLNGLSVFMNREGNDCYPSTRRLAEATGLTERSVCTHIAVAESAGWILVGSRGNRGQAWSLNEYWATVPEAVLEALAAAPADSQEELFDREDLDDIRGKGTEGGSVPFRQGTEPGAEGTEPDDKKALKEVQLKEPVNQSKERVNRSSVSDETDAARRASFPQIDNDWTENAVLGQIRKLWYPPDGQPPDGWAVAQERSIIRQFLRRGQSLSRIATMIEGLALMREAGLLKAAAPGEKLTSRMVYDQSNSDVRELFERAVDYVWMAEARGGRNVRGFATVGTLLEQMVKPPP